MSGTRGTGMQRYRLFMWIATALWLIAAIAAVIDRDTLNAVAWFGFVAAGALTASGATERSRGVGLPVHRAVGSSRGNLGERVPHRLGAAVETLWASHDLRRTHLLGGWVNKGKKKSRSPKGPRPRKAFGPWVAPRDARFCLRTASSTTGLCRWDCAVPVRPRPREPPHPSTGKSSPCSSQRRSTLS